MERPDYEFPPHAPDIGRDIALRCLRPRSSGWNHCAAERGPDGAARHPYQGQEKRNGSFGVAVAHMKYLDEYRDGERAQQFAREIRRLTTRTWNIMEVCGGQTHAIVKFGIDELLPKQITLIHGPGCPVCVTPLEMIDKALDIAARPNVIFTSFGDMLRVPGSTTDLLSVKATGGDVRIVYFTARRGKNRGTKIRRRKLFSSASVLKPPRRPRRWRFIRLRKKG